MTDLRAYLDRLEQITLPGHSARDAAFHVPRLVRLLRRSVEALEWIVKENDDPADVLCASRALTDLDALARGEQG